MDSWLDFQSDMITHLLSGLKASELLFTSNPTSSLVTLYCPDQSCGSSMWQLGRTIECFSPLAVCITPSSIMKVSSQEEGFWVRFSSIFLSPVSEEYIVFSNMELPSNSVRQPRETSVPWIVWGVTWTTLTNTQEEFVVPDIIGCYFKIVCGS